MLKGHGSEVGALAYSPDGKTLVTGGIGGFRVWGAGGELRNAVRHPDTAWAVAFAPDGKLLAVGSGGMMVGSLAFSRTGAIGCRAVQRGRRTP